MPLRFPAQHVVRKLFRSSASAWDGCPPCQSLSVFFSPPVLETLVALRLDVGDLEVGRGRPIAHAVRFIVQ